MAGINLDITDDDVYVDPVKGIRVIEICATFAEFSKTRIITITVGGKFAYKGYYTGDYSQQVQALIVDSGDTEFIAHAAVEMLPDGTTPKTRIKATMYLATGQGQSWSGEQYIQFGRVSRNGKIGEISHAYFGSDCTVTINPPEIQDAYEDMDEYLIFNLDFYLGGWSYSVNDVQYNPMYPDKNRSVTLKIPIEVINRIPKDMLCGIVKVELRTYSYCDVTTQIGETSTATFRVFVPDDIKPIIYSPSAGLYSLEYINDSIKQFMTEIGMGNTAVSGLTKVKISAYGEGIYNSSVERYKISNGYSKTLFKEFDSTAGGSFFVNYTGGVVYSRNDSDHINFDVLCIDSRGRKSNTITASVPLIRYVAPKVSGFSVYKDTKTGRIKMRAEWNTLSSNNSVFSDNNHYTAKVQYRKSSPNEITNQNWLGEFEVGNGEEYSLDMELDGFATYIFRIIVTDKIGMSDMEYAFITASSVPLDLKRGGKGLGIGKICEHDQLEVAMDAVFENGILINDMSLADYIKAQSFIIKDSAYGDWSNASQSPEHGQIYFNCVQNII